jgi:hypothetical protein
MGEGASPG